MIDNIENVQMDGLISIHDTLTDMVKEDKIEDFKMEYDDENKILNINLIPKLTIEYIETEINLGSNSEFFNDLKK